MISHPIQPLCNADCKVLILGSFPSVISREKKSYYANPSNRFWKVLECIYDEQITDREEFILRHHLGLWDVIGSCDLVGSDDASIRNVIVNPIDKFIQNFNIKAIVLNGKKAEQLFDANFKNCNIKIIRCPSTSGANARMSLCDLVEHYKIVKEL